MRPHSRRAFLGDVGRGMLIAGLGTSLAADLGIPTALASETGTLDFGKLQPLVGLLQETPVERLQPLLVRKLQQGQTDLQQLVAAAALANAESFGGEDYVGFHTEMALLPALQMIDELPSERRPLPVLKVLYRNTQRIQEFGPEKKTLRQVAPADVSAAAGGPELREATRAADFDKAEGVFAALSRRPLEEAYNHLMWSVQDDANVHRFVLAHRAYGLIDVVGRDNAHTMLRQCVRFCVNHEQNRLNRKAPAPPLRRLLPRLLDQYKLAGRKGGTRRADDAWVEHLSRTVYESTKEQAADAVAAALAEGFAPEDVAEAISLAANQYVLRQGREMWRTHGDSAGVHSSDAANAWRNMVRVSNDRNTMAGLIVSGYHTALYNRFDSAPYPTEEHLAAVKTRDPRRLLAEAEEAIRANDQGRAAAAIQLYGAEGGAPRPVFDLMLRYAISEDGRLHAEKYYRTVTEEFATTRPAFRWRQLVALARVTASAYGYDRVDKQTGRAPGYEEACRLLGV